MGKNINLAIEIAKDESLDYEKVGLFGRLRSRLILLPFFYLVPKGGGIFLFKKSSRVASEVRRLAKTSHALEFLYTFDGRIKFTNSFFDGIFTYFWQHNLINAKAVRNRIKLAKRELYFAVAKVYLEKSKTVNLFSLASGSARAILEVIGDLKKAAIPVHAKLLDLDPTALERSKKIAAENDVLDSISLCKDKVSNFLNYCKGWQPDVIEMIGFLDYLNQEKAIFLCDKIYNVLPSGGFFITCNIVDNYERKFITKILDWDMIYRDTNNLIEVLTGGGFYPQNCKIIYEPTLIHALAIGKK